MTLEDLRLWSPVFFIAWNLMLTLGIWLRKPGTDASAELAQYKASTATQLARIDVELAGIKAQMQHMPTSEEQARLEGVVRQLDERTKAHSDAMDTVRHQLNRIESYLLDKGK